MFGNYDGWMSFINNLHCVKHIYTNGKAVHLQDFLLFIVEITAFFID
jgi:hypothetical protein